MRKVIDFLLIVVVIVNLFILITSYTSIFGYKTFKIITGSMEPVIKINSIVITKEKDTYKPNDIVTIQKNYKYYTHRIEKINDKEVITKGDKNNVVDKPTKVENIVGEVKIIITDFKYLLIKLACIALLLVSLIITLFTRKEK